MYKRIFLSVISIIAFFRIEAQNEITLEELIQKAELNYPLIQQKSLIESLGEENKKELNVQYLPQLSVIGQATFQNEVTTFSLPGVSGPPLGQKKDNYNVGLDLRLPLTDFGLLKSKKEMEQTATSLRVNKLEVEMQQVRERITNIFGNVLLQQENKKILLIRKLELETQQKKVAVGVANGATLKNNQLVLESEILTTEQQILDIEATLSSLCEQLSILTGITILPDQKFLLNATESVLTEINRPELMVFKDQLNVLDLQKKVLKRGNIPKFYLFGQGYYGRPGYNFLNTDYRPYGMVGAGLSWNINDVVTQRNKSKSIDLNKELIGKQQETFNLNLQTSLIQKRTEINKYDAIIKKDQEIVDKRKEILQLAVSQLDNGVITSTEYLTELNAENAAELNLTLHKVQQAIAKTQYNRLTGN